MDPTPPELTWTAEGTPRSVRFDDVYYSAADGLAESRHVFLRGNDLPGRWERCGEAEFRILELGFGTGLNLLAVWDAWRHCRARRPRRLRYLAIEAYPLGAESLRRALEPWPQLRPLSQRLAQLWPAAPSGVLELALEEGLTLELHIGDAATVLQGMDVPGRGLADAWFLDGFAPARNPAMWTSAIYRQMTRLSRAEATFATFTAAGHVRRGLRAAGFEVHKQRGFGRKRDMLAGRLAGDWPLEQPWWLPPAGRRPQRVAVIGAGLAGCATVYSLARRGIACVLIDRHPQPAAEASGNLAGAYYPYLSQDLNIASRLSLAAFGVLQQRLEELAGAGLPVRGEACGVLRSGGAAEAARERRIAALPELAGLNLRYLEHSAALAGLELGPGLWIPAGGWLHPPSLCCQQLAWARGRGLLEQQFGQPVRAVSATPQGWTVRLEGGEAVAGLDAVVCCSGAAQAPWLPPRHLPLRPARGGVSHLRARAASAALRAVVCHAGYATPAVDGYHCVGATLDNRERDTTLRYEDHQRNLDALRRRLPGLARALGADAAEPPGLGGRAAVRMTSPDRLPVIGPAPDWAQWLQDYAAIGRGRRRRFPAPALQPGLYLNLGHGSRGITTTPWAGELIAALLCNEPLPLEPRLWPALHPGRFLVRELQRPAPAG